MLRSGAYNQIKPGKLRNAWCFARFYFYYRFSRSIKIRAENIRTENCQSLMMKLTLFYKKGSRIAQFKIRTEYIVLPWSSSSTGWNPLHSSFFS
jgi:hypothetical protein